MCVGEGAIGALICGLGVQRVRAMARWAKGWMALDLGVKELG